MIRRWAAAIVLAWTIVLVNLLSIPSASGAPVQAPGVSASRVLIMPFESDTREPRAYWLGEGSAVMLTDSLLALGLPVMTRDERVHSFELLRVPLVSGLSHATIIRVGQVVGVSQLIVGSFALAGDRLTVRAKSIAIGTGLTGPEMTESGPLSQMFEIYDRLALHLVPGAAAPAQTSHPPTAAFEQFVKGLLAQKPATKLSFLAEALRLSPSLHRAHLAAWEVHNDLGEHDRALASAQAVPADDRLGRQARFLASISLLELKRYRESFDELTKLNAEQRDATLLNNLGVVQLRRPAGSGGARASSYFNEAAGLDAADAFFNLGYAYWLDGDASAAVMWLREAVRRNPADHAAHYVLAVALAAVGNPVEAGRERDLAKQLSSTYAEWEAKARAGTVPAGLERLRTTLGLPDALRVETAIGAAGQRDQQQLASFHLDAGRRAFEAEHDAEAVTQLRRVVYLAPYDHDAHLLLGRVYLRGGRLNDAIDALKISIWSSDTVAARLVLADAYEKAGMVMEARRELQAVLVRDGSNAEARQRLDRLAGR